MVNQSNWKETTLGAELTFQRGFDISKKEQFAGRYWVISSSGPSSQHSEAKVKGPGVVIGRKGTLGTVFFSENDYWPHSTTLWIKDFHGNDERFAYYFLQTMGLERFDAGASNPTLNRNHIHLLPIRYPVPILQRKIAAILSAYDDLIENNTRRIAVLEEMARSLYREWFVEFRFPGHEQVRMVDDVPEGWEIRGIGEVIEVVGGGTPSTQERDYWEDGTITWFSPSDLTAAGTMFIADSSKKITQLGLQKSSARLFPAYSVMMTSRATIGVTAINTKAACTNQGFITCLPNQQLSTYQIYFWVGDNREKIIGLASGATFKEINKATFRQLPIVIADSYTRTRFVETLDPICKQIVNLQTKNTNLRRTRDLLLPRLISGELDVEELEIAGVEAL